jgi:hypothetical protein
MAISRPTSPGVNCRAMAMAGAMIHKAPGPQSFAQCPAENHRKSDRVSRFPIMLTAFPHRQRG